MQLAIVVLHKTGHSSDSFRDISVGSGSVAVPAKALQIAATRHAYERFDLLQALHGIHHLVSGFVLFDEPIHQGIDFGPVFRADVGGIVAEMLEMLILLQHWRLIDVVVGGYVVFTRVLGDLPNVLGIVSADVDVKEHHIAIHILLLHQIFDVFA